MSLRSSCVLIFLRKLVLMHLKCCVIFLRSYSKMIYPSNGSAHRLRCTVYRKISRGFYFRETSHMRSFAKVNPSQNAEITLLFTDVGKSFSSRDFLSL